MNVNQLMELVVKYGTLREQRLELLNDAASASTDDEKMRCDYQADKAYFDANTILAAIEDELRKLEDAK